MKKSYLLLVITKNSLWAKLGALDFKMPLIFALTLSPPPLIK